MPSSFLVGVGAGVDIMVGREVGGEIGWQLVGSPMEGIVAGRHNRSWDWC
jgi:hypothetical protein